MSEIKSVTFRYEDGQEETLSPEQFNTIYLSARVVKPKVEVVNNDMDLRIDLSYLPEEVRDYVTDQLLDRLDEGVPFLEIIGQIECDAKDGIIIVTSVMLEFIQKIIEEKEHDIDYERRHGERE